MIRTLFGRRDIIVIGVIAHVACVFVAWSATRDMNYLLFVPLFIAVAATRLANIRRFDKALPGIKSMSDLDSWERSYVIVGSGTSLLVGLLAGYTGFSNADTIAGAIGHGMVGGTMITIVGRNFGSLRGVRVFIYTSCLPVIVGYAVSAATLSQPLLFVAVLPIVVVILTGFSTSANLHGLLQTALKTRRQAEIASQKFEAAIASMPNGLIVVDGNQRMVVINRRGNELLGGRLVEGGDIVQALSNAVIEPGDLIASLTEGVFIGLDGSDYQTRDGRWLRFGTSSLAASGAYLDEEWGGRQEGAYILTILDVTNRVEDEKKLVHLARFDGLTGLANRRWWEEHGQASVEAEQPGTLVALAVLDVDRFKLINDTLGHHIGDKVIQGVAARLRAVGDIRSFPGRLGGDEFVVLLNGVRDLEDARVFFDKLFASICSTFHIEGHSIEVRCSGGVIIRPREQFDILTDLSRADLALYKVKRTSRPWLLFDDVLEEEYQTSVRIKHDLRDAIETDALELVYQPIYDAQGERIVSAEALCRWQHGEAGNIPPSRFIAMAEEIGVIGQLTEYVLRKACQECMTWNSDVSVAVNLSAIDLSRDGIIDMIVNALADAGMPPGRLCVEVTETVFVKDFDKTAETLLRLREMGVKTSLDDFGTGYSSLSYMHRLPLNRVKIDRSFVETIASDSKTQQLFSAVVGLAKGLGFEVVVEGVENQDQLDRVIDVPGVDMIQGHIFSEGLTNEDMARHGSLRRTPQAGGKIIRLVRDARG